MRFCVMITAMMASTLVFAGTECQTPIKLSKVDEFPANSTGDPTKPNPGNLEMFLHVPVGLAGTADVVVVMHGCTQSAASFDDQAEWRNLANKYKFILVMPQQPYASDKNKYNINNALKCFNWNGYYGYNSKRGEGEAASIAQMVEYVKKKYPVNNAYVTGFSAGGSMAVRMCAQHPDLFAGCSFFAAAPYMCGKPDNETGDIVRDRAFACMGVQDDGFFTPRFGKGCTSNVACSTPEFLQSKDKIVPLITKQGQQGDPWPRVMIWQGDQDQLVDPRLATILRDQWLMAHKLSDANQVTYKLNDTSKKYTVTAFGKDRDPAVVQITLKGMPHAIPVDPGKRVDQGGMVHEDFWAGGYSFDWDVYGSYESIEFFGITQRSPQTCDQASNPSSKTAPTKPASSLELKI